MTRAFIALGGNVGAVEDTFDRALAELAAHPSISVGARSAVYRTKPVGAESGDEFRNAAAELETDLPPLELLDVLQEVEHRHGRVRAGRWTPRTLDLDLLLYGRSVIDSPRLQVPHPACWYRRFVLDPLAEIAADVVHPQKQTTVAELRAWLLVRPLPVQVAGGEPATRRRLVDELQTSFPDASVAEWADGEPQPEPAILFWLGANSAAADAAEPEIQFEHLPRVPRLDISQASDTTTSACEVLAAALG